MIYTYTDDNVPLSKVGGKAYNLAHLSKIKNIRVPKWICLSTDVFYEFLGERAKEYQRLLQSYTPKNREKIIRIINRCEFSEELRDKISGVLLDIFQPNTKFAIRSSATDEDSDNFSFAGMLDSSLNVNLNEVFRHIKKCYISGFLERVMEYRAKNGLVREDIAVAVIVQEMVEAELAGVMFTINPKTNNPDETQISLVTGTGEQLVSGEKNSIDFVVDIMGEITEGDINKVNKDIILDLARQGEIIENSYEKRTGKDIEFAIAKSGKIFMLQCRTIAKYAFVDKRKPRTILDNSNIIESYSGVTTPLTYTFAKEVYGKIYHQTLKNFFIPESVVRSVSHDLNNMLYFYENKIYYKLNSWYKLMSLYPNYNTNKKYMENMMGVKTPLKETTIGTNKRLIKIYSSFLYKMLTLKKHSRKFLKKFNQVTEPYNGDTFEGKSNKELLKIYTKIESQILNDFTTPIINDIGAMVFYGMLTDSLKKHGVKDAEGTISSILSRQGNVESAEQTENLLKIVDKIKDDNELKNRFLSKDISLNDNDKIVSDIKDYLAKFGARSMDELKLETVTMQENPELLFDMIRNYLKIDNKKRNINSKSIQEAEVYKNYKLIARWYVKTLFKIVKYLVRNRESLRLRRTYIYAIVRNIYLRIGKNFKESGILSNHRDIFWLEKDEIKAIIHGAKNDDARDIVRKRKTEYEKNKNKVVYERMYFYGEVRDDNMLPIYSKQEVEDEANILRGVAGGGEPIEGIVKYIEDPTSADINGYILMAKRTDPGWTVLFPMAKAIIIERGSILSHSAVIAREMGITLVVGIRGLTDKVKDGDKIRVDGINGTIEILG